VLQLLAHGNQHVGHAAQQSATERGGCALSPRTSRPGQGLINEEVVSGFPQYLGLLFKCQVVLSVVEKLAHLAALILLLLV
jgi:hypothetical protein